MGLTEMIPTQRLDLSFNLEMYLPLLSLSCIYYVCIDGSVSGNKYGVYFLSLVYRGQEIKILEIDSTTPTMTLLSGKLDFYRGGTDTKDSVLIGLITKITYHSN